MNKTLGFALLAGGAAWIAYQMNLLCGFGFGPSCATPATPATPVTPTSAPPAFATPGWTAPPTPAPTTTPSVPAPGSTSFYLVGPVSPDINNAIKGQVSIAGSVRTLDLTPDGRAFDTSGQDVTASLINQGVDPNAILASMQNALAAQQAAASNTISGKPTADQIAATQASITALQSQLASAPPVMQPIFQQQIVTLQNALAAMKTRAGMSGLGMGRNAYLYPIHRARPINYVRKRRLA
jgi:hypothetical protein